MSRHILNCLSRADAVLGGLIRAVGPCRLETSTDGHPFQILARAIAHQQLNGTAANTILKRLVDSVGAGVFPTPEQVLAIARAGRTASCHEALFTLGDRPERRYAAARTALKHLGHESTTSYLQAKIGRAHV